MLYIAYLTLLDLGLAGYTIVGLLGLATLLALAVVGMAAMPDRSEGAVRRLRAVGAAAGVCFGLGLAASGAFVFASWRPLLRDDNVRPWRPALSVSDQFDFITQAGSGLLMAGAAALPFALFLGIAAALWAMQPARDAEAPPVGRAIIRASLAAVAVAVAVGLMVYAWDAPLPIRECGTSDNVACMARGRDEAAKALSSARIGVIAVVVLGGALFVGATLWRREGSGLGRGDTVAAAVIFALGLGSWVGTRSFAEDGRHPLSPRNPRDHGCPVWSFDPQKLPPAGRCSSGENVALVELSAAGLRVDGQPGKLEDLLNDLRTTRERSLRPRQHLVLIAAPADLPLAAVRPTLAAIQEAWEPAFEIVVVQEPRAARSETLGDVPRKSLCCATPLRPDAPGAATATTWGELAAAATAAP